MRSEIILIIGIVLSISACSTFGPSLAKEPADSTQPENPELPTFSPSVQVAPKQQMVSLKEYDQLKEAFELQQQEIKNLKQSQANDRKKFKQLEEKLLTNFSLMEHTVSKSLEEMDEKIQQPAMARSSNDLPQTSQANSNQVQKINESSASNNQRKPLIENISLFSAEKPSSSARSLTGKTLIPSPLPIPSNEKIVTEEEIPLPKKTVEAEESIIIPLPLPLPLPSPSEHEEEFKDPNLDPPKNPYALQRRPHVKKLYNKGLDALVNSKYEDAIQNFNELLRKFPDDEYGDNAQLWLGMAHFSQKQLDLAEEAFYKILQHYEHRNSGGYKTPDAIYMLGKVAMSRNNIKRAKYYYNEVIKRFPNSISAGNAEEELKNINNL